MSADPGLFLRSLDGSMAKVVLALLFERGGMTVEELELRTGLSAKTLRKSLHTLASSMYGMVASQRGAHGRVLWMPSNALLPAFRQGLALDAGRQAALEDQGQNGKVFPSDNEPEIQSGRFFPSGDENDAQNGKFFPSGASRVEDSSHLAGSSLINDDDESILNLDSSSSEPAERKNLPSCETLLGHLGLLFDQELDTTGLPVAQMNRGHVLGWIIKAWQDRQRLSNPLGLLRSRLAQRAKRSYGNWRVLPDAYLVAVGMASAERVVDPDEMVRSLLRGGA